MVVNRMDLPAIDYELLDQMWFKLTQIEHIEKNSDYWSFNRQMVEQNMLVIATSDKDRIVIDGRSVSTYPGILVCCKPGQWVEFGTAASENQGLYLLYYESGGLPSAESDIALTQHPEKAFLGIEDEYYAPAAMILCEAMYHNWHNPDRSNRFLSQAGFQQILAMLHKKPEQETTAALETARKIIEQRYDEELTIERLAETAGISRYHFMRLFKERYNKSVIDYLTEVRLNRAKLLMREGKHTLNEISARVGYQSEHYFRTTFKRLVGISPAIYMKNRQTKVAAYSWQVIGALLPLQIVPFAAPIDHYWTDFFNQKFHGDIIIPLAHDYEFNRKALRAVQPDFIIGLSATVDEQERAKLTEIAPVLLLDTDKNDWREHLLLTAEFLDKTKDAVKWLASYDHKAKEIREKVKAKLQEDTLLFLKISKEQLFIWGRKAATVWYDDLRLQPVQGIEHIEWFELIELEQLADLDAERIVLSVNADMASQIYWNSLLAADSWQKLRAVQNKKLHIIPGPEWWVLPWVENTAFNHERSLDEAVNLFLCDNT